MDAGRQSVRIEPMNVIPLQSGSKGNCFFIESNQTRLLVDAGITFRQANLRLQSHHRDIYDVDHIFVTHDHSDHSKYIWDYQKRLSVPVHLTPKTKVAIKGSAPPDSTNSIRCFSAGDSIQAGNILVHSIPTPHDAADGVAFVLECDGHRIGILTDLGYAFAGLKEILKSLDAVIIESNYDDTMLNSGPYPEFLKRRIRGNGGHLSNQDSAKLIYKFGSANMQWVCLCHLSDENNCPETAIRAHQAWLGDDFPLFVANRHEVSEMMRVQ